MTSATKAYWTKPVAVAELKVDSIHGHVFHLSSNGTFVAYEFKERNVPSKAVTVDTIFFQDFADLLHDNKLAGLVALQVLDTCQESTKIEFEVGPQGIVMLDEKDVLQLGLTRMTTGWSFGVGDDGIISCTGNGTHAPKTNASHQVFVDTKPIPDVDALKTALREEGVVA